MRVLYPDLVFGAIASSGVVHATVDDWYYFDIIREFAPADCMARVAEAVDEVDALLERPETHDAVKAVFGLQNLTYDPDFASLLTVSKLDVAIRARLPLPCPCPCPGVFGVRGPERGSCGLPRRGASSSSKGGVGF